MLSTARQFVIAKRGGQFPQLGLRPGRYLPGVLRREVLSSLGHTTEAEIQDCFTGKGGKGAGGKGKGDGPGAAGKREAGQRLSVAMQREHKQRKA